MGLAETIQTVNKFIGNGGVLASITNPATGKLALSFDNQGEIIEVEDGDTRVTEL